MDGSSKNGTHLSGLTVSPANGAVLSFRVIPLCFHVIYWFSSSSRGTFAYYPFVCQHLFWQYILMIRPFYRFFFGGKVVFIILQLHFKLVYFIRRKYSISIVQKKNMSFIMKHSLNYWCIYSWFDNRSLLTAFLRSWTYDSDKKILIEYRGIMQCGFFCSPIFAHNLACS